MAIGDPVYGARTALANISRLHSDTNGYVTAFGEVDNNTSPKADYMIHIKIPINASATSGSYDIYIVESQDGAEWTDAIDPATDAAYADFLQDARFVKSASTIYDNSPTGARTSVEFHFRVSEYTGYPAPPYFGFVVKNSSGQSIPASGADGDSQSISIASS
jgi:hypothetical protein